MYRDISVMKTLVNPSSTDSRKRTSSPKGNDAHLRAIIQSEKNGNINFSDAQGQLTLWSVVGSGRISNSSKLLCMSSLPVSMKRIPSRTTEKKWQHRFSNITLAVAMETSGRIWPNFELIQAFMDVLIACKYEKDQMKNSGGKVMTTFSPL